MADVVSRLLHRAAEHPWIGAAIGTLGRVQSRRTNLLSVLTYHRIDDGAAFRRLMEHVTANYRLPAVDQIEQALLGGPALPPRSLLVTFDDAHRSFGELAWPVLRELGIPAVLFVPTGFPDRPERVFWWERLEHAVQETRRPELDSPVGPLALRTPHDRRLAYAALRQHVKSLPYARLLEEVECLAGELEVEPPPGAVHTRDELLVLEAQGCVLGAHTVTHPFLDDLPLSDVRKEVSRSRDDLRLWTGKVPRLFAYPDGRFDRAAVDAVREAGFLAAFTTTGGTNDLTRTDPMLLRRIHCGGADSVPVLRARLLYASPLLSRLRPAPAAPG